MTARLQVAAERSAVTRQGEVEREPVVGVVQGRREQLLYPAQPGGDRVAVHAEHRGGVAAEQPASR